MAIRTDGDQMIDQPFVVHPMLIRCGGLLHSADQIRRAPSLKEQQR
jgi:hypothetical protein